MTPKKAAPGLMSVFEEFLKELSDPFDNGQLTEDSIFIDGANLVDLDDECLKILIDNLWDLYE